MVYTIALFGETEKGEYKKPYHCRSLHQLCDFLGGPANNDSRGLTYAIQALLYQYEVIFFRVHEEGFSVSDYLRGLSYLESKNAAGAAVNAIGLPGVGNTEIIQATGPICQVHKSFLIISEKDLYDYLTCRF